MNFAGVWTEMSSIMIFNIKHERQTLRHNITFEKEGKKRSEFVGVELVRK